MECCNYVQQHNQQQQPPYYGTTPYNHPLYYHHPHQHQHLAGVYQPPQYTPAPYGYGHHLQHREPLPCSPYYHQQHYPPPPPPLTDLYMAAAYRYHAEERRQEFYGPPSSYYHRPHWLESPTQPSSLSPHAPGYPYEAPKEAAYLRKAPPDTTAAAMSPCPALAAPGPSPMLPPIRQRHWMSPPPSSTHLYGTVDSTSSEESPRIGSANNQEVALSTRGLPAATPNSEGAPPLSPVAPYAEPVESCRTPPQVTSTWQPPPVENDARTRASNFSTPSPVNPASAASNVSSSPRAISPRTESTPESYEQLSRPTYVNAPYQRFIPASTSKGKKGSGKTSQYKQQESKKALPDFNEAFGGTERGRFQSPPVAASWPQPLECYYLDGPTGAASDLFL